MIQIPRFKDDKYWHGYKIEDCKLVNLGCGSKPFKNFINIDNLFTENVEYTNSDVSDLQMFQNETIDYLYASHVLEHIERVKTFSTLLEWNRVLKFGGMLRISVPDWDASVSYYNKTHDLENLLNWIYGGRENEQLNEFSHKRIFNFDNLRSLLYEAGFKRIEKYNPFNTFHGNIDDFSFARRPHMDFDNGIEMSLNVQAWK